MTRFGEPECVWPVATMLGEGPLWSPSAQALWFVDIKKNHIHRFEPATGTKKTWNTPENPGFIVPAMDGGFVVGLQAGLHRFDPASGAFTLLFAVDPAMPSNRLNDGAVDPSGRLWFGSMDNRETEPTGSLYRLDKDGPVAIDGGYVITNGPAFSPDGKILYHTDTRRSTIYAFDVADDGSVGGKRVFVTIEDGAGRPDGPVTDAEGCVWTGLYRGGAVRRYSPEGKLLSTVRFPCANVTKMVFGGPDLRSAFATTAWKGLDDAARAAQPMAGGLFRFDVAVAGLPQRAVAL
jgi:D-xylonolactonase